MILNPWGCLKNTESGKYGEVIYENTVYRNKNIRWQEYLNYD